MFNFTMKDLQNDDEITYEVHTTTKVVVCKGLGKLMNIYGGKNIADYNEDMTNKKDFRFNISKVVRNGELVFVSKNSIHKEIYAMKCKIDKLKCNIAYSNKELISLNKELIKTKNKFHMLKGMEEI